MDLLISGFMVDFISPCLTSGFTSASAIIIIIAQLKNLFGIPFQSHDAFEILKEFSQRFGEIKIYDTLLGCCCIVFLLVFKVSEEGNIPPSSLHIRQFIGY